MILPALYFSLLLLIDLIGHGVVFDFRFKADDTHRSLWDLALCQRLDRRRLICQSVTFGAFINGFEVADGAFDWVTPFSLFTGFTLVDTLLIVPVILAYTAWAYCMFCGKVKAGERSY